MPDVKTSKAEKIIKRRKHSRVINVLMELISISTITKRILDLEINLTAGKLIILALVVKKQLTKAIIRD